MDAPTSSRRVSSVHGRDVSRGADRSHSRLRSVSRASRVGTVDKEDRIDIDVLAPGSIRRAEPRSNVDCDSDQLVGQSKESGSGISGGGNCTKRGQRLPCSDPPLATELSPEAMPSELSKRHAEDSLDCRVLEASERATSQEPAYSNYGKTTSRLPNRSRLRGVGRESVAPVFHENNLKRLLSRERRVSTECQTGASKSGDGHTGAPLTTGLSRFFNSPVAAARAAAEAAQGHGNALLAALSVITGPAEGDTSKEKHNEQVEGQGKEGGTREQEEVYDSRSLSLKGHTKGYRDMWVVAEADLQRGGSAGSADPEDTTLGRSGGDTDDETARASRSQSSSTASSVEEESFQSKAEVTQGTAPALCRKASHGDRNAAVLSEDSFDASKWRRRSRCRVGCQERFQRAGSAVAAEDRGGAGGAFSGFLETLSRSYTEAVNMVDALAMEFGTEEQQVGEHSRRKALGARRSTTAKGEGRSGTQSTRLESDEERPGSAGPRSSIGSIAERRNAEGREPSPDHAHGASSSPRRRRPSFSVASSESMETHHIAPCSSLSRLVPASVSLGMEEGVKKTSKKHSFFSSVATAAGNALAEAGAMAGALAAVAAAVVGESNSEDSSDSSARRAGTSANRRKWKSVSRNEHQLGRRKGAYNLGPREKAGLSQSGCQSQGLGWEEEVGEEDGGDETENEEGRLLFLKEGATPFEFVLWATEDSDASLQRPLLSAPPAAPPDDSEVGGAVSSIDRREYVRLCRLRAVALRLLLLICQDSSWCPGPGKKKNLITDRDDAFIAGRPTWPRAGTECDDAGVFVDVDPEMEEEEEIEKLWQEWTAVPDKKGSSSEEETKNDRASRMRLMWKAAHRMLAVDGRLGRLRFDLVPRRLKELAFWKAYFYQVALVMTRYERQAHELLRSLASSAPRGKIQNNTRQGSSGSLLHLLTESSNSETSSSCSTPQYDTSPECSSRVYVPPPSALRRDGNASECGGGALEGGLCTGSREDSGPSSEGIMDILDCGSGDPSLINAAALRDASPVLHDREGMGTSSAGATSVPEWQAVGDASLSVTRSDVSGTPKRASQPGTAGPPLSCFRGSPHRESGTRVL